MPDPAAAPPAEGVRLPWAELPASVRAAVEEALGAPVVSAATQPGGFSPGVAARLVGADGSRAFVKAVSRDVNRDSVALYRAEAGVSAVLPADLPAPRLRWWRDDGSWVVLLSDDVEGRQPAVPWRADELDRVLRAVAALHERCTPSPLPDLPPARDRLARMFTGWQGLAAEPDLAGQVDGWSLRHLDRLVRVERGVAARLGGDTLLHLDLRADNVLLTADGGVVFVDWPYAANGPAWLDLVLMAPCVAVQGGPPPADLLAACRSSAGADREALTAAVVALAGYLTYRSLLPPPPGLPTVRAFQAVQGVPCRQWAAQLTGWR